MLKDGEVIGVVTRSDLLRAFDEPVSEAREGRRRRSPSGSRALERLAPVFEAVQAVSERFDGVYLVGGAVRDVLMGEPTFDIDIAVEGDGIAFAEALAGALGGRAVPHEKFGTAIVIAGTASAWTSRRREPSSTITRPRCPASSGRRSARTSSGGTSRSTRWRPRLRARTSDGSSTPSAGFGTSSGRVVRVLHNLSFIDDPTRIFRAIRYENRYGFAMDGHTVASRALASRWISWASSPRRG